MAAIMSACHPADAVKKSPYRLKAAKKGTAAFSVLSVGADDTCFLAHTKIFCTISPLVFAE
jgi:hypothetical protein